ERNRSAPGAGECRPKNHLLQLGGPARTSCGNVGSFSEMIRQAKMTSRFAPLCCRCSHTIYTVAKPFQVKRGQMRLSTHGGRSSARFLRLCVTGAFLVLSAMAWAQSRNRVPDHVPPKRSSQIQDGFGINSDLPRDPYLPWNRWWWTRMFDAGFK